MFQYFQTITVATQVARRKIFYFPRSHFGSSLFKTDEIKSYNLAQIQNVLAKSLM